jgi:ribosomal protein S18 acetylase RimI-like enzyme
MHWRIRAAEAGDVDALALIGAATFLETFAGVLEGPAIVAHCLKEHSATAYRRYLAGGAEAWLVEAAEGAAPIGFALLAKADIPGGDPAVDLELKRIYSLSRFHGTGLGRALMETAIAAAALRAERLLLGVYAGNGRALAFYRKHGFEQIGERRFRVGARDYDDLVLARSLA